MKKLIFTGLWLLFVLFQANCQYTTLNAHSHNDYIQDIPFWTAYYAHFGSIEADIWEENGELMVAHSKDNIRPERTLDNLYIQPLVKIYKQNHGKAWNNMPGSIQLLIDLKAPDAKLLDLLVEKLKKYPEVFDRQVNPNAINVVITGDRPSPSSFAKYPVFIKFDGDLRLKYSGQELERVAMFSEDLRKYTNWNGKGNIIASEQKRIQNIIDSVHALGNKIRFWDAPDGVSAWKTLMNLKVDFINTDHIGKLADFLNSRPKAEYTSLEKHEIYKPSYRNNDAETKVKNVILLVGDGTGLAQQYAGFTANGGALTLFGMRNIGFSKTWSADEYITDSAAGGSALSTGKKTQNRHLGIDSLDHPNLNIPEAIQPMGLVSGLVTTDEAVGATPAAFYAHFAERDSGQEIASFFPQSPVNLLVGGNPDPFTKRRDGRNLLSELKNKGFSIVDDVNKLPDVKSGKVITVDNAISRSEADGRGNLLPMATQNAIRLLSQNRKGFFLMVEGAQIDFGGHANSVPYVVREMLDFDKVVEAALRFADQNGETLVIVTADHETGGLTILDGNFSKGMVDGQFSTSDHTGIMVPVFAYGPHSMDFRGVYENTEIFKKIIHVFELYNK